MAFLDLFRPKWRHSDPSVRLSALKGLADQAVLAQVAKTDPAPEVRLAGVERLTHQEVLTQVAKLDRDSGVSMAAMNRLTDQALLAEVARGSPAPGVCEAAVGKLTDQALLAQVARAADSPAARRAAVSRLTDQAILADVAKTASDRDVRKAAVERLTDQAVLAQVAETGSDAAVRRAAAARITDPTLRAQITKVIKLAVMAYEERSGLLRFRGQDAKKRQFDLSDVSQPALLFVPRETLPYLKRDQKLWSRVKNPEARFDKDSGIRQASKAGRGVLTGLVGPLMDGIQAVDLLPGEFWISVVDTYLDATSAVVLSGIF